MSKFLIVLDDLEDWAPYYPSEHIISIDDYLSQDTQEKQRVRVINLCRDYSYLSEGYYCSLMAEARGHHVIPSVNVLNDLGSPSLYQLQLGSIDRSLSKKLDRLENTSEITFLSYFGVTSDPLVQPLARLFFERFPCPILSVTLHREEEWRVTEIKSVDHCSLNDTEQTDFANALDQFCKKVWREKKQKRSARYEIAILVNPEEKLPPSNEKAIKKFIKAGKSISVDVETITPNEYMRIPEFDALFIRETTAIDHHTYRFAKMAETEGLVVIDDPASILKCTNKIFLSTLFEKNHVPAPRTVILRQNKQAQQLEQAVETLGFPLVLKIPNGSFSRGVVKVKTLEDLQREAEVLFKESSLLLAQEYLYTEFDWRIGVLNNKPLYACRYYMVKNHWQIYRHGSSRTDSGAFDTLPTYEVPKPILQAALKATKLIGNGFYGVDVKEHNNKGYVIEVNDNPSIDAGVEDQYLGNELYVIILQELVSRLDKIRSADV